MLTRGKQARVLPKHIGRLVTGDMGKGLVDAQNLALGIGDADAVADAGEYQVGQLAFGFARLARADVEQGADD